MQPTYCCRVTKHETDDIQTAVYSKYTWTITLQQKPYTMKTPERKGGLQCIKKKGVKYDYGERMMIIKPVGISARQGRLLWRAH